MTKSMAVNARSWLIGGAFLVLIAAGVSYLLTRRGTGLKSGWDEDLDTAFQSRHASGTSHREALSALEDGRFEQALRFYRTLSGREWEANDCFRLGEALLKRNRVVLGGAAFEAARRIEPAHMPSARALNALQGKIALATGSERATLHEAASQSELLRKISTGPALALFVLELACHSRGVEQEDEFLDRLDSHHRSRLGRINSAAGAILLTARLLLETGRTTEAVDLLNPLVFNQVTLGTSSTERLVSQEAAWLLSRAAIQADQQERADAMLSLAGDFGRTEGSFPEPSPFVGSRRCGECHPRIYREQQRGSRHAQTLRFGEGLRDVPLPAAPVEDPIIKNISHTFTRKYVDQIELESRVENHIFRAVVEYAVGSGRHGITMLAKDEEGVDRELRVSYFGAGHGWGATKGIDFAPHDAGDHIGIGLGRKSLNHCLSCHTTWFRSVGPGPSNMRRPERADRGIGCERCHGPGLNHAKAAETGYAELAIALVLDTPSQARLNSCVECHAADGSIEPSDPEFTRAQGTTFLFSRCYTAAKDRFNCTTCHDAHRAVDTQARHYEVKCLSCHDGQSILEPELSHAGGKRGAVPERRICPINAQENCISCHMPKVDDPTRRSRFTDHHIRVHPDLASASRDGPGH